MGSGKFAGRWTDVGAVLGEIPAASAGMTEMGRGCDGGCRWFVGIWGGMGPIPARGRE